VKVISRKSFYGLGRCDIEIESGNEFFHSVNGFLMDSKSCIVLRYGGSESIVPIPATVQTVGENCFGGLDSITEIAFAPGSEIREIEYFAFGNCSGLLSITFPSSFVSMAEEAFADCNSLTSVLFELPAQIRCFGKSAFDTCDDLIQITIPSSVEVLDAGCFHDCEQLRQISFEADSKLVRIESDAFQGCLLLDEFCVPSSVELIDINCFEGCDALSHLKFSAPSRVRELLSLPPFLRGVQEIPDSVQVLRFSITPRTDVAVTDREDPRCVLLFGRESRLHHIGKYLPPSVQPEDAHLSFRLFLQLSSQSVKVLRLIREFESDDEDFSDES
jgi:hypothetical protein